MRQLKVFQKMVEKGAYVSEYNAHFYPANPSMSGLIHRNYRPVYYSPSSRSALAEAELIYKDKSISHSVYVCFTLDMRDIMFTDKYTTDFSFWSSKLGWAYPDDNPRVRSAVKCQEGMVAKDYTPMDLETLQEKKGKVGFLVWTTTPWTLSANMVCGARV